MNELDVYPNTLHKIILKKIHIIYICTMKQISNLVKIAQNFKKKSNH